MNLFKTLAMVGLVGVGMVGCKKSNPVDPIKQKASAIINEAKEKRERLTSYRYNEEWISSGLNNYTNNYVTYIKRLPDGREYKRQDRVTIETQLPKSTVICEVSPLIQSNGVVAITQSLIPPKSNQSTENRVIHISFLETPEASYSISGDQAVKTLPKRKVIRKAAIEGVSLVKKNGLKMIAEESSISITNSSINGYDCNLIEFKLSDATIKNNKDIMESYSFRSLITSKQFGISDSNIANTIKLMVDDMPVRDLMAIDKKTGIVIRTSRLNQKGKITYSNTISNIETNVTFPEDFFQLPPNVKVTKDESKEPTFIQDVKDKIRNLF